MLPKDDKSPVEPGKSGLIDKKNVKQLALPMDNYEEEEGSPRIENTDSKAIPSKLLEGFGDSFNPNEQKRKKTATDYKKRGSPKYF